MSLVVALGSNIGDRKDALTKALVQLIKTFGKPIAVSNIYESKAYGVTDQADFLNAAVEFNSPSFSPQKTLQICLDIENQLGRVRKLKWGPRIIDIDILYFDTLSINTDSLKIPHPYIFERDFVLMPLSELPCGKQNLSNLSIPINTDSCRIVDQFSF